MRVFVTGGSGFVGSRFIRILLKNKNIVYALSRKNKKSQKNLIWIKGRLDGIFKQLSFCDVLVHFAAAGVNNKNLSYNKIYKTNVIESSKLLINAANAGCLNWVIIGTSSEYGVNNLSKNFKKFSVSTKPNPLMEKLNIFSQRFLINLQKNTMPILGCYACFLLMALEKIKKECFLL